MPVRIPWTTRLAAPKSPMPALSTTATTTMAEPRPTSPRVRTPVGLPCRSRLRPRTPPIRVAAESRSAISIQSMGLRLGETRQPDAFQAVAELMLRRASGVVCATFAASLVFVGHRPAPSGQVARLGALCQPQGLLDGAAEITLDRLALQSAAEEVGP